MMETKEVWMRVGITITAAPDVIDKIRQGDEEALLAALKGEAGTACFDGESYIPEEFEEGTYRSGVDFDLYPTPIQTAEPEKSGRKNKVKNQER